MKARQTFQRGFVSDPIRTRHGTVFVIRYRIRNDPGTWKHRSETLHGVAGKKQARDVLNQRIRECSTQTVAIRELTLSSFVDTYWRPYLDRKQIKPSTRRSYD